MTQSFTRRFVTMLALVVGLAFAGDTLAQGTSGTNPTARSVTEEQLFQQLDKITGRITIPDGKAATPSASRWNCMPHAVSPMRKAW